MRMRNIEKCMKNQEKWKKDPETEMELDNWKEK